MSDLALLREYVATRDEQAFAAISSRYVDLVYSAALRQLRDRSTAEDATQQVFVQLAQSAETIRESQALAGWLLTTTRAISLNMLRSEIRRRKREHEAVLIREHVRAEKMNWEAIAPILDEAVTSLRNKDRDAITLRYLNQQSLRDVAKELGVSEPAAQKRVSRALAKLRSFLVRRGIRATPRDLASLMTANVLTVSAAAFKAQVVETASSNITVASSASLSKGAIILMTFSKTKLAIAAICVLAIVTIPAVVTVRRANHETRLNEVYALAPEENVKYVQQSPTPERANLYQAGHGLTPLDPSLVVISLWDGHQFEFQMGSRDGYSLAEILRQVAGIWSQDTTLSDEQRLMPLKGDWIVRSDATEAQKMADIGRILSTILGRPVSFVRKPMEREAIVARGQFQYKALPGGTKSEFTLPIKLYTGSNSNQHGLEDEVFQDPAEMLQGLGHRIDMPVVNETPPSKETKPIGFETTESGRLWARAPDSAAVDNLLANVAKQTGLSFTRERRLLPTWKLEPTSGK